MDNKERPDSEEILREARIKIIKIASVGIAGAIILSCYAYTQIDDTVTQMILYGISSLISTVAMLFIFGAVSLGRAEKNRKNFFLYDRKTKADMPLSALTFSEVRHRLLDFMSIFKRRGKLYVGDLFDENPHIPEHFKPLFCYEILYELAIEDGAMDARSFLGFGGECADIFTKYLRQTEDYELATAIRTYIFDYSEENDNTKGFKEYIKSKREHIEAKMLGYAKQNIEKFK